MGVLKGSDRREKTSVGTRDEECILLMFWIFIGGEGLRESGKQRRRSIGNRDIRHGATS